MRGWTNPENQPRVPAVPAATWMVGEETPRIFIVGILHHDANAAQTEWLFVHVFFPNHREEQRTGRVHDGDIREEPIAIIRIEGVDDAEEERVLRH